MTLALNLLCRVLRRRVSKGENLDSVLAEYPKLTEEEQKEVRARVLTAAN